MADGKVIYEIFGDNSHFTESINELQGIAAGAMKSIATGATALGTATAAGIKKATDASIEYESAFTGVKKTVEEVLDANGNVIYSYDMISDAIRDLSSEIPATASEIAHVAESAGQLGIAAENVVEFSRVMIALGESTNLSSEEAASQLARFANITQMSQADFGKLGSVIVDLGNNFATTEADIVNMGMRLAGTGKTVGMSESEILGIAAALSSVGIEAEMGGSAISRLLVDMSLAAETGEGAQAFADAIGISVDKFSNAFKDDAAGTLGAFISGLATAEKRGKSAIAVLEDMGISEVRLRDALLRAANAQSLFSDTQAVANEAWEENTALALEAEKRYGTTESQIRILQNDVNDLAISIGDVFSGKLSDSIPTIESWVGKLNEAFSNDGFSGAIAEAGNIIGDFITKVAEGAPQAISTISDLILNIGDALTSNASSISEAGLAIVDQLAEGMRQQLPNLATIAAEIAPALVEGFMQYKSLMLEVGLTLLVGIAEGIAENIDQLVDSAVKIAMSLCDFLMENIDTLLAAGIAIIEGIGMGIAENLPELLPKIMDLIIYLVNSITENAVQLAEAAIAIIGALALGLLEALPDLLAKVPELIMALITAFTTSAPDLVASGVEIVTQLINGIMSFAAKMGETGTQIIVSFIDGFKSLISNAEQAAQDMGQRIVESVRNFVSDFVSIGSQMLQGLIDGIKSKISDAVSAVSEGVSNIIEAAKGFLGIASPSKVFHWIGDMTVEGLAEGIDDDTLAVDAVKHLTRDISATADLNIPDLSGLGNSLALGAASSAPVVVQNVMHGTVDVDGYTLGTIMLKNLDDAAAFAVRGS